LPSTLPSTSPTSTPSTSPSRLPSNTPTTSLPTASPSKFPSARKRACVYINDIVWLLDSGRALQFPPNILVSQLSSLVGLLINFCWFES
jgi:hypothetical protein